MMGGKVLKEVTLLVAVTALVAISATDVQGQLFDDRGSDHGVISFSVFGGGVSPVSDLSDGSEFDSSGTVGGTVSVCLWDYVGVRGNVLWGRTDSDFTMGSPLENDDPDIWLYNGDVLLRLPISAGDSGWLYPYVLGGLGAKTYDFSQNGTDTQFAGNVGGGLEFRFGRAGTWGVNLEVRDFISDFDESGLEGTQNDLVYTGGITLSF